MKMSGFNFYNENNEGAVSSTVAMTSYSHRIQFGLKVRKNV